MTPVPHLVQYQGSKRKLASRILEYVPYEFNRLIEPFAGMAAITLAVADSKHVNEFVINDLNAPLVGLLKAAVESPAKVFTEYAELWSEQFNFKEGHIQHYYHVRDKFNAGDRCPANMLYLLARCVKGSVRYGKDGNFNQSPDKRRHGVSPKKLQDNIFAVSRLLRGWTTFYSADYREMFDMAQKGDLIYMDPPYQGVSDTRDKRYLAGLSFDDFVESLYILNSKGVDFLISYDGVCGEKEYGKELPTDLECKKILLNAGLSTQATLLGRRETTLEALYVSRNLKKQRPLIEEGLLFAEAM